MTLFVEQPGQKSNHTFDLSDRGLLMGDGVFDTCFARNGHIFQESLHWFRLAAAANAIGIDLSAGQIRQFVHDRVPPETSGVIRTSITRGPGKRGLASEPNAGPTILLKIDPLDESYQYASARLVISGQRRNPFSVTSRFKTLSYIDNVIAAREARAAGADEALMLSTKDSVACCSAANLFIRNADTIITPPISHGAMPGTIRNWVLSNCHKIGLNAVVHPLSIKDVLSAETVFITNSVRLISQVVQLADQSYPVEDKSDLQTLLSETLEDFINGKHVSA